MCFINKIKKSKKNIFIRATQTASPKSGENLNGNELHLPKKRITVNLNTYFLFSTPCCYGTEFCRSCSVSETEFGRWFCTAVVAGRSATIAEIQNVQSPRYLKQFSVSRFLKLIYPVHSWSININVMYSNRSFFFLSRL